VVQINTGKEGEAALSRWWELGSMPAILCYRIRFLSSQRMTTSAWIHTFDFEWNKNKSSQAYTFDIVIVVFGLHQ